MRFQGGGIGHKSTREATDKFLQDRDWLDKGTGPIRNSDEDVEDELETDGSNEEHGGQGDEDDVDNKSGAGSGNDAGGGGEDDEQALGSEDDGFGGNEDDDYGYSTNTIDDEDDNELPTEFADDELGPEDGEGDIDKMYLLGFAAL